jgi:hypothetical protein
VEVSFIGEGEYPEKTINLLQVTDELVVNSTTIRSLVAIHYSNKPLPNHMYELVAIHYFNKPLPNHKYELVAIH